MEEKARNERAIEMQKDKKRLLIWGCGHDFFERLPRIRAMETAGRVTVVAVTDSRDPGTAHVEGYRYIPPESIRGERYDYILILSRRYEEEILETYLRLPGSERKKAICRGPLRFRDLDEFQYAEILKARPTIFSRACWGGFLYHHLGMECISPFKNLWLEDSEFLRFLESPREYMACEPEPDHMQTALTAWDVDPYPVLRLGDISLHCNHSRSAEQAISDWRRRREKINWNFTFAMMHTVQPQIEKRFNRLETTDRKLCIVPYATKEPASWQLKPKNGASDLDAWGYDDVNKTALPNLNPFEIHSLFFGELKRNEHYVHDS